MWLDSQLGLQCVKLRKVWTIILLMVKNIIIILTHLFILEHLCGSSIYSILCLQTGVKWLHFSYFLYCLLEMCFMSVLNVALLCYYNCCYIFVQWSDMMFILFLFELLILLTLSNFINSASWNRNSTHLFFGSTCL